MQSDPSARPDAPDASSEGSPGEIPEHARTMMRNLAVDRATVDVVTKLEAAGAGVIVLKGPSVARWLYEPGERTYVDIDILMRPGDEQTVAAVLTELGYTTGSPPVLDLDRASYQEWSLDPTSPPLDVHPTLNLLEQLPPEVVWEVLAEEVSQLELPGGAVPVLNEGARALHVALHSLSHGSRSAQAATDLERAVSRVSEQTWRDALRVAERLDSTSLLSQALHYADGGVELAARLGLRWVSDPRTQIRGRGSPSQQAAALGVWWWSSLRTKDKLRLLGRKMFPSRGYLEARSPLARRGGAGLVVAYAARPFIILGWGLRGAVGWARARRMKR